MQGRGEAAAGVARDEARLARHDQTNRGTQHLLLQALERANMAAAWKRVKATPPTSLETVGAASPLAWESLGQVPRAKDGRHYRDKRARLGSGSFAPPRGSD